MLAGVVGGMLGVFVVLASYYLNPDFNLRNPLRGLLGRGRRTGPGD
jgi:hypothetical protein